METFAVKELSQLSGVSVRTLHYYDQIQLLKPLHRTEAGYRCYGEDQLIRLQQILFFKELDFSLKEISAMLDEPGFDVVVALEKHKKALNKRKKRISQLLETIDNTIIKLKIGEIMNNPAMLYKGLPKEFETSYREEAIETYGAETIERSEKSLMKKGKGKFDKLNEQFKAINRALFDLKMTPPESDRVQILIEQHYQAIRQYWGTSHSKDTQVEAYTGLGELYTQDERYTQVDGEPQPEFASFLKKAMTHFAKTTLT